MENGKKKFFYGWVIVAVLFLVGMVPMVLVQNYSSYYQVPMTTEFGCTYTAFSFASMLGSIGGMVFSMLLASKMGKGNTKLWMTCCCVLAGVFVFLQSYLTAIWQYWVTQFIIAFLFSGITYIPINTLLARWFVDKKGFATSLVFSGVGVGGMLFAPILANIIATSGWRMSFRYVGVATAAVGVLIFLLVANSPADKGMQPLMAAKKDDAPAAAPAAGPMPGLTKAEAVKTSAFYFFLIAVFAGGILAAGIVTQVPTYIIENGGDYALVMVCYSAAALVSKLILGPIFDKTGIVVGGTVIAICTAGALICFMLVPQNLVFGFIGAVLLGFNNIHTFITPLMNGKLFGYKDFAGIFGLANVLFMGGCMIGPVLAAGIRTSTGSYFSAWAVLLAAVVLYYVFMLIGMSCEKKMQATWH